MQETLSVISKLGLSFFSQARVLTLVISYTRSEIRDELYQHLFALFLQLTMPL